jgi:flagellar biosynthesis/type III secretory pathway protein FliH
LSKGYTTDEKEAAAFEKGFSDGYEAGRQKGFAEGWDAAMKEAKKEESS